MRSAGLPESYRKALATGLWPSLDVLPAARLNIAADGTTSTTSTLNGGRLTIANTTDRTSATLLERGAVLDVGGGASDR
eukprot:gene47769-biopygen33264